MENPEHVAVVTQGKDELDTWREEHPDTELNLSGANLRRVYLSEADLSGAYFRRADLRAAGFFMANLSGADLSDADLTAADLSAANLSGANLSGADLSRANLREADLRGAILREADLRGAELEKADLEGADLTGAQFEGATLKATTTRYARFVRTRGLFGGKRAAIQDVTDADWAFLSWRKDFCVWPRLRLIGTLRLTGASYVAFIAIVLYALFANWYNKTAPKLLDQAAHSTSSPANTTSAQIAFRDADGASLTDRAVNWTIDRTLDRVEKRVRQRAHTEIDRARAEGGAVEALARRFARMPTPAHLAYQLLAIAALAIGATIYTVRCPDLIKENTQTRWTRELNQPLLEYRAAEYHEPLMRYACLLFYGGGGLYTLYYLAGRGLDALEALGMMGG